MQRRYVTARIIDHARRHGDVITRRQAVALGATARQLTELAVTGVLVRRFPGVYVLAGVGDDHLVATQAALAALGDPGAVASHFSAAWLQGLVDRPAPDVHVTAGPVHRHLAGVVVHRSMAPAAVVRRRFQGVPCTLPARTLIDLAASVTAAQLADAVDRALSAAIVRTDDLVAETRKSGRRRGTDRLRRCLEERGAVNVPAPSVLESRMARLLHHYGLPAARAEMTVGPDGEYRLDYSFPPARVALELYGYAWHHSPAQMTRDLRRQRRLTVDGWKVLIYTWQEVTGEPARVAREIQEALVSAGSSEPTTGGHLGRRSASTP